MYCAHCGKELVEGANFCTACGSRSAVAERLAAAAEASTEEAGGVSAALASGRSRSRLRMSPLILLILTLALTAGIAAAAYYVYTQVYMPSVEQVSHGASSELQHENSAMEAGANYTVSYESLPGGDDDERFVYPVITSTTPNASLDALNTMMRDKVREAADNSITTAEKMSYDANRPEDFDQGLRYMTCKYIVTYLDEDVISILGIDYQMHIYNAHGSPKTECISINLKTGESVVPESVLGLDKDALFEATYEVASTAKSAMSTDLQQEVRTVVDNSSERFFLIPGGIALAFNGDDFVGVPYSFGSAVVYSDDSMPNLKSGTFFYDDLPVSYGGEGYMSITDLKNIVLQST